VRPISSLSLPLTTSPDWLVLRLLTIAYVHDCFLHVFFSIPPSFFASELDWCLPVEDALWNATSSQEWYTLLQQPSPYGSAATRLTGLSIRAALAVLGDAHMPTPGLTLPAFAHFVLINSALSSILCLSGAHTVSASDPSSGHHDVLGGKMRDFSHQYTLHNWLQGWVRAPDGPVSPEKADQEPLFTRNAMPYYWLAQATLVAIPEDFSGKPGFFVTPETRFRVLGQWLVHIRNFLRSSQSDSAGLWIQLMKIMSEDGHGARTDAEGMQALRPDL
jgi:hypothetical protein